MATNNVIEESLNTIPKQISRLLLKKEDQKGFFFGLNDSNFKPDNTEGKQRYIEFIRFVFGALNKFSISRSPFESYPTNDLSEDEKTKFQEKIDKYSIYNNVKAVRASIKKITAVGATSGYNQAFLTYDELQSYNRKTFGLHMQYEDYDTGKPYFLLEIFEQRIAAMKACIEEYEGTDKKSETELLFLKIESQREELILSLIKSKITVIEASELSKEMKEERKLTLIKTELEKMSSYIIWGSKHIVCYYNLDGTLKTKEELDPYVDTMLTQLEEAKTKDKSCVKKLMTFLPLDNFLIRNTTTQKEFPLDTDSSEKDALLSGPENNYEFDFDERKLREFYISNGIPHDYETGEELSNLRQTPNGIIKGPQLQYRLGLLRELFHDESRKAYSDIIGLFNVFGLDVDLFHNCGKYVNYNIHLNLLKMYIQNFKKTSVFSTSLSLAKSRRHTILDETTETYEFRYRPRIDINTLFNRGIKLLGMQCIKYKIPGNYHLGILPFFIFLNTNYSLLRALPKNDPRISSFNNGLISLYAGQASETIIYDQKMCFVEDGEITPSMSITYHELATLMYYGAKAYIIDADRKELYFTMLPNDNPELQKLVRLLKMIRVFFVKGKVEGFQRERFKVMTKEEVDSELAKPEPPWRLMGKQVVDQESSFAGGYKKSNKSTNKIKTAKTTKTTKTRKMLKLKQHNKTNKTKKNTKTNKTVKNNKSHKIYAIKTKKIIK